jgi:RNA polymerase sigma factor (sigma-70 family)
MTEELLGRGDLVIQRLQQAFAHEEPATDLAAVMQRAARYQAGEPRGVQDPPPGFSLTQADLVAARRREPAAVARLYTAYAPALFRFFMAAVGDRRQAEELTGTVLASAIEGLVRFRGPVEELGGWLFGIARHDLYDYRRRQARSRIEPLEDDLGEVGAAVSAPEIRGRESGTETTFWSDQVTHPALYRLSPRERKILSLLAVGWSKRRIAEHCSFSLHTVRTHVQNILVKLEVHSKLEAASLALEQGWTSAAADLEAAAAGHPEGTPLAAALRQLSPDQREVLMLQLVGGLTAPEVATVLGMTVGQVKALRHRGQASLARALGPRSLDQLQERLWSRAPSLGESRGTLGVKPFPAALSTTEGSQRRGQPGVDRKP